MSSSHVSGTSSSSAAASISAWAASSASRSLSNFATKAASSSGVSSCSCGASTSLRSSSVTGASALCFSCCASNAETASSPSTVVRPVSSPAGFLRTTVSVPSRFFCEVTVLPFASVTTIGAATTVPAASACASASSFSWFANSARAELGAKALAPAPRDPPTVAAM